MLVMSKEIIEISSAGQRMDASLFTPNPHNGKHSAVMTIHGMTSSKDGYEPIVERLVEEHGIVGMAVSIRGHGNSEGSRSILRIKDGITDGFAAYKYLINLPYVDQNKIGIIGASFGGAIAAMIAGRENIRSLVLRVPATYDLRMMNMTDDNVMRKEVDVFNKMLVEDILKTLPVAALSEYSGALFVISSEHDHVIPNKMIQAFLDIATHASVKEHLMIRGATHNLSNNQWREEFRNAAIAFLVRTL